MSRDTGSIQEIEWDGDHGLTARMCPPGSTSYEVRQGEWSERGHLTVIR